MISNEFCDTLYLICVSRPYRLRGKAVRRRGLTDVRTVFEHRGVGGCTR